MTDSTPPEPPSAAPGDFGQPSDYMRPTEPGYSGGYDPAGAYDPAGSYPPAPAAGYGSTYPPRYPPTSTFGPTYPSGSGYGGYPPPGATTTSFGPPPFDPPQFGRPPADQPARPRRAGNPIVIAVVVAALVGAGVGAVTVAALNHGTRTIASGITVSTASAQNSAKIDGTVTAAAAKIQPSVVTINVAGQNESGTGSGVVLRTDGYILTNDHVVAVAGTGGTIQVITTDGQSGNATVVGTDQSDDLAVIKVAGLKNLTKADFAPSSALQVGQTVVAVGAPLGLSNTVTAGIVSNTARPVQTGDSTGNSQAVFDAIQTDAAINPGNSGGPLVNLNGDVVGIDAAIASANSGGLQVPGQTTQSGSIGIGFAIPSDEASRIAAELITTGKATHAVLGVDVQDSNQTTSITTTIGATIHAVTPNGAAAKAGLRVGDVVTKVENQLIVEDVDLVAAIRSFAPGQHVTIAYQRGGTSHTVQVTLGTASS